MSLYPTPTRLALLADVDAGIVYEHKELAYNQVYCHLSNGEAKVKVTDKIRELHAAGWVATGPSMGVGTGMWRMELTEEGRRVLLASGQVAGP